MRIVRLFVRKAKAWLIDWFPVALILSILLITCLTIFVLTTNWMKQNDLEVIESEEPKWVLEEDGSWTCYSDGKKAEDDVQCACANQPEIVVPEG